MANILFSTIWAHYPSSPPCVDKKTGKPPANYDNQCAMKVGYALEKSGVSFESYKDRRCPSARKTSGLVVNAQDLADWLGPSRFSGCPKRESYTGKKAFEEIDGRTGIIFLANYWKTPADKGLKRTGDHIDLWNGSRMTSAWSWFRIQLGISWDGVWTDYRLATSVLFWHIP